MEGAMHVLPERQFGRELADEVLTEMAMGYLQLGLHGSWIDPAKCNERFGRWERTELEARFSEHPPEEVARWLIEAAADITRLGVETAVDRFVEHMYPSSFPISCT
jgi:hypothetical protein